jgi:hypothetical protein
VDERRLDEQVASDQRRRDEPVQPRHVPTHPVAHRPSREERDAPADRREGGVRGERRELPLEPARVGHVVRVHPGDHVGVTGGEPAVQGARDPLAGAAQHAHPPVARREPVEHLGRRVGRAVVDADEREVALGLAQDRDGGRPDRGGRVARGQEDGDPRHRGRS